MDQTTRAVLFLTDEFRRCEKDKPLMLESILFCPLLTWASEKMKADGVRRFFIVCAPAFAAEARACFDAGDSVTVSDVPEALAAFLSEDGPVAVFPSAVLPLESGVRVDANPSFFLAEASALRFAGTPWTAGSVADASPLSGYTDLETLRQDFSEAAGRVPDTGELLDAVTPLCLRWSVERVQRGGVRVLDPANTYIGPRVEIGRGTLVLPGTILRGRVRIGTDCEIGPNSVIRECAIGDGTTVNVSQLNESTVGSRTNVGPFAYVRPGSTIGNDIKVGDFVEVKNSVIGDGTKISHLTYVGDSDVGRRVNFGCGTVTTNYDGFHKYRTTVGNDVFIGCNTNLVAPVQVGDGAYIAAGATITEDVPADALAIARSRQSVKEGWAARRREAHGKQSK